MKRPEGFDVPAPEPPPARRAREAPARRPVREKPVREKPVREAPVERPPRPAASRLAEAELKAAERARKRAERQELRRFTRRQRQRRIAWLTAAGIVLALVGLSVGAVYSPLLALREIKVVGATSLDPAKLVGAIDGQLGTPLALLDEGELRRRLGEFPLIRSYTTEILPPGTLIVHIVERTPLGVVADGGAFQVLDAAGVVLSSTPERPEGLPLVQLTSREVGSAAYRSIAAVLTALPASLLAQVDIVAATTRDDVTLTLVGSVQRVVWGSAEDSDHKARVLAALIGIHGGSGAGVYDVSAPGTAVFHAD